jgi:putative nucleotidyltransferase with HDIG domain
MNKSDKTKRKVFQWAKLLRGAEKGAFPTGEKDAGPSIWVRPEAQKWYILFGLSLIISILLFPNILTRPQQYKLGDVADRDIKAESEFLVENKELTDQNRHEAVKAVLSVYDFDPDATNIVSRIREAFKSGGEFLAECHSATHTPEDTKEGQPMSADSFKEQFFEILDIPAEDGVFDILLKNGFPSEAEEAIIRLVTEVLENGVVSNKMMLMSESARGIVLHDIHTGKGVNATDLERFYDLKAAENFIKGQRGALERSMTSRELAGATVKLAASLIKPNLTFNKRESELRKDLARKSVKPFYFKIKKGEMLVREGERITPEHLLKLSDQYKSVKQREMLGRAPAMAVLIGFLVSAMYLVGLISNRSSREGVKDLLFSALTLLTIFLVVIAANFVAEEIARGYHFFTPMALLFAIPVASGAMIISVFHGMSVAASFSLIVAVLACLVVGGQVEFFIYFFISSLVAAYGVKNCRERGIFIKTGLKVSVCNIVLALSIEALHGSFHTLEALIALASAFIGGILVGVIATGILPLIEMSFGYTTDIKLLELASLDQPLLRELMVQAPGTHHHSVMVSNLVEAPAEAIDANPLLAKVAAYYHDIGKMNKPQYFIENQTGSQNKHEKLAPSMSSLILISHVKDGVEMAKGYKVGMEIIDIIRQHHGTSLISFFYEKAKEQAEKKGGRSALVKAEDFRYPGPRPQSKEAGLVMLADIVEAASRTLVDPTAARIQGLVQKIINKVFSDGQLDQCGLTLKDLHEIARSFNKTLNGIFHHRIEYPESLTKTAHAGKGDNGNTDKFSESDSRAKKAGDKKEDGESLKRLGLS